MKNVQVLCTTMHQKDFSLINKMNIHSDVVFANQSDETGYSEMEFDGNKAKMITTATRGVGVNRNLALMYADKDILLLADDDLEYVDDYADIVQKAFSEIPDADAIVFNADPVGGNEERIKNTTFNKKIGRVRFYNCLKYATHRMCVKADVLKKENIYFHRSFGGGAEYSAGEDTLFIWDMVKKGFKIYTYPATIATVHQEKSSWFEGYNEKLLFDNGVLFCALSKRFAKLLCLQSLIRHPYTYKETGLSFIQAYSVMKKGIKAFNICKVYCDDIKQN